MKTHGRHSPEHQTAVKRRFIIIHNRNKSRKRRRCKRTKEGAVKEYGYMYEDSLAFWKRARAISMRRAAYALCHRAAMIFHDIA